MTQLTERIQGHQVWRELADLGPALDQASGRWGIPAPAATGIERLRTVLAYSKTRLGSIEPFLLDPRPLGNIATTLASLRAEVQAFSSDTNAAHIDAANTHADDVLAGLSNVGSPPTPDELATIGEAAGNYHATLEKYLAEALEKHTEVSTAAEANSTTLAALATELATEKQRLAVLISDYQAQFAAGQTTRSTEHTAAQTERQSTFSGAQDSRGNEFTVAQTDRQQKFTDAATENQTLFSASQEARAKEFVAAQTDRSQAVAALIAEYTVVLADHKAELVKVRESAAKTAEDALATVRVTYEEAAKRILEKIEEHKTQVEKLVGVIGNLGVTSGYQKVANRAQKAIYLWQSLTVLALAGLILVAYVIASSPVGAESVFLQGLSTRVFLSLTVGVFAAYAAKQAANNMEIERKSRKLALELEALGPFIAPLPIEMQNKFRADVGDRSFGIPDGQVAKGEGRDPVSAADLVPILRDTVSELLKKIK